MKTFGEIMGFLSLINSLLKKVYGNFEDYEHPIMYFKKEEVYSPLFKKLAFIFALFGFFLCLYPNKDLVLLIRNVFWIFSFYFFFFLVVFRSFFEGYKYIELLIFDMFCISLFSSFVCMYVLFVYFYFFKISL